MRKKTIDGWLVFNWKEGSHRTRKSEPDELGTYELATELEIDVEIPEVDVPSFAAKVEVPQPRVQTAVLESLDDDAFPEWSDVCEQKLEENVDRIGRADGLDEVDRIVDELTTQVLLELDGLAQPEKVRAFLEDQSHRLHREYTPTPGDR